MQFKKFFFVFPVALLALFFTIFSCTKETVQTENVAATGEEGTEIIDLGVLDRNETYNLSWNTSNGLDVEYEVINSANNQVLHNRAWYSHASGTDSYSAPDGLTVHARLKGRRLFPGSGQDNLYWTWKRATCPVKSGTYVVTAPYNTPWNTILPYRIASYSLPCASE